MNRDLEIVLSNCPISPLWSEESFLGNLEDSGVWDMPKYWQFEFSLYALVEHDFEESMYAALFKIFTRLLRLFLSNYHELDVFTFKNLTADEVHEFHERIEMVFEGAFFRQMPMQEWFTLKNPHL